MNNLCLTLPVCWIQALQLWLSSLQCWICSSLDFSEENKKISPWRITLISSWPTSNFGILLQQSGEYLLGHLVGMRIYILVSQLSTRCRERMWGMLGFRNPDSISIRQPCHCLHNPKLLPGSLSSSKSKAFYSTANKISIWLQASHSGLRMVSN